MAVKFRGDYEGIGHMLRAPFMVADMRRRAEAVKAFAEATAPVGTDRSPTDADQTVYKDSFRVEWGVHTATWKGKTTTRAYGRVLNVSLHAVYVEYGRKHHDPNRHATLRRALIAVAHL
jgi:hypothetical protein